MTNKNNLEWIGEIRNSQLVTTYGSGALCDFPGVSGIISGINNWEISKDDIVKLKFREPNLENLLSVDFFIQMISDEKGKNFFIPVYRFPEWYYCPKCGSLNSYKQISYKPEDNKILY